MPPLLRTILITGFAILIAALNMSPRGLALCLGGVHADGSRLVAWCDEHRTHHHDPVRAHVDSGHHRHGAAHGRGHSHGHAHGHRHHHHGGHGHDHSHDHDHEHPCSDLPLGLDDCRIQSAERLISAAADVHDITPVIAPHAAPAADLARPAQVHIRHLHPARHGPPGDVCAILRAVIILV